MQPILFQLIMQEMQQSTKALEEQRDLTRMVLLHLGQQQKQLSGSLSLQLLIYQAQMQQGVAPVSHSLPLKRSADDMQSEAQPASKNAMRRQKAKIRMEKKLHNNEAAVQQLQERSQRQANLNPATSGAAFEDDADHADISTSSSAAAGARCKFNPAADVQAETDRSTVQPAVHHKDIPGHGRGIAWQGWLGVHSTLASMLLGLHTLAGIV